MKNIEEIKYVFIKETAQNKLMNKKYKKVSTILNYMEHFLILGSKITGCVSISAFASLVGILIGITSSALGLKMCAITAVIKKYNLRIKKKKEWSSIIKKKNKMHDKIVLLAKS